MIKIPSAPAILALLIFQSLFVNCVCSVKKDSEVEPNNVFSAANPLNVGNPMVGFIDSREDRDFYILSVEEPCISDISISGIKGVNHSLSLWRGGVSPALLKTADDNRKSSPERLKNLYLEAGEYYIAVQHGDRDQKNENRETPYTLTCETRVPVAEEFEPNDSILAANRIQLNTETSGFFSPAYNRLNLGKENLYREEDWFGFSVARETDDPVILTIDVSGVPGVNSELYLLNSGGEVIASSDNGSSGMPEAINNAGIAQDGDYFIMLTGKGYGSNNDEPYVLRLATGAYDRSNEFEVNDSFDRANVIHENSIRGRIDSPNDRDCFLYEPVQGGYHRIEIRPAGLVDLRAVVHDATGNMLTELNYAGAGEPEIFADYYIGAPIYLTVFSPEALQGVDMAYSCAITPLSSSSAFEKENNNSKENATPLPQGEMLGYISYKGDRDFYIMESPRKMMKELVITGVKGGEIKVSVTDPLGYTLKSVLVRGDSRVTIREMIEGRGFIVVDPVKENYDHPYRLQAGGAK